MGQDIRERSARLLAIAAVAVTLISVASTGAIGALAGSGPTDLDAGADDVRPVGSAEVAGPGAQERIGTYGVAAVISTNDTYVSQFKDGDNKPAETNENQSIPPTNTAVGDVTKFFQMQSSTDGGSVAGVAMDNTDLNVGFNISNIPDGYNHTIQIRFKAKGNARTSEDYIVSVVAENGTTVFSTFTMPYQTTFAQVDHPLGASARSYVNQHGSIYLVMEDSAAAGDSVTQEVDFLRVHTLSDYTPPSISNGLLVDDTDGDGNVTDGDTISVFADVSDGESGVASVTTDASIFGGSASLELFDNDSDGTYNATFTATTSGTDGTHSLTITATDNATTPNANTTTTNTLTLDTAPPSVTNPTITDATDGNGVVGADHDVLVEATVTDATLKNVTADTSGFGGPAALNLTDPDGDDVFNATVAVDGPNATEGDQTVTITAFDWMNKSTQNTTNSLNVDLTPPTVSKANLVDDSNGDGTVNNGDTVLVNATITDLTALNVTTNASIFGGPDSLTLTDPDGNDVFNATFTVDTANASTDGDYNLTVNASDAANNTASAITNDLTLSRDTADTTAPSVTNATLTDDTDGNDVVGDTHQLTVSADVTDNQNVGNVTADASAFGAGTVTLTDGDGDGNYNASFTVDAASASPDGDYALNVTADDGSGNVGFQETGTVTLDTTAPSVTNPTLSEGSGDGVVGDGDSITVSADVSDATSATVTANASAFGAGTVTLTDGDTDGTYDVTFTVDAASAAGDGAHSLTVNATDEGLNDASNTTNTLTLDTTPPSTSNGNLVEVTGPVDGNVTDGDTVLVNATVTDATALNVTTNASAFGGPASLDLTDPDGDDVFNATFTVDAANATGTNGNAYALTANATDAGDNWNTTTTNTLTLDFDTNPPSVTNATLVDATDGNGVVGDTHELTVSADVTDDTSVKNVTADASAFGAGTVTLTDGDGDGTYNLTFSVDAASASADGSYNLTVTAFDDVGNSASDATGNVTLDTTAPAATNGNLVELTGPVDGTVLDGDTVLVNATVTDATALNITTNASVFGGPSDLTLTDPDGDDVFNATFTVDTANATGSDGNSYALTVNASDQADNENTTTTNSLTLNPDTTAPTVTNATLTEGAGDGVVGDGDQVTVGADVSDGGTIANVTANASVFGAGDVDLSLVSGDRYEATFTVDAANASADGSYNLTVNSTDASGNSATNTTGNLTLDTTAPTVTDATLTDLTDGDTVVGDGDRVEVAANVSDATNVTVTADASAFGVGTVTLSDGDGDGRYNHTFTAGSGGTDGAHALTVNVTDAGDNTGANTTGNLTLDTTAPVFTDANLVDDSNGDGTVLDGDTVQVNATMTDLTALNVTTNASVFGGPSSLELFDNDSDGTYNATFTVNTTTAWGDDGTAYSLTVNATDAASNSNQTDTNTLTLNPDSTTPTVTDATLTESAGDGVVGDGDQVTIGANVTDAGGVSSVTANASVFGNGSVTLSHVSGDRYEATFTVDEARAAADGSYNLTVNATDTSGNSATNTTGNLTLDTTPPSVSNANLVDLTDGDGNVSDGDSVLVNVTATDATDLNVTTDASEFGAGTVVLSDPDGDDVFNATFTVNESAAANAGDYDLQVTATDAGDNSNTTVTNTLTLDRTTADTGPPTVTNATLTDDTDGNGVVGDDDAFVVEANVTDDTSVSSVTADASDFGAGTLTLSPVSGDHYRATGTVGDASAAADGDHDVTITATDGAGNTTTATTGTLTLDTTKPSVSNAYLVDVTDGDVTVEDGDTVLVNVTATDSTGLTVTADASDFGGGTVTLTDPDGDDVFNETFTVDTASASADGSYSLTVTATDDGGNAGTATTNSLTLERPSQPPAGGGGGGGGGGGNGAARTSVSVSPGADGSYSVLVTDTRGGRPVRVRLPAAADGRIDLDVLEFTTTRRLSMTLTARSTSEAPSESGPYPDDEGRRAIGYLSIDHPDTPNDQIGPSTIRFSVRRSVLEAEGVEPDQITLYRFSDGEWTELPTRVDAQNPERVFYLADSPGLSVFAVGVGSPVLSLGDASLSTSRLETGQAVEVAATVVNRGGYRGSFTATLSVEGVSTDERTVSVEPGESATVDLRHVFAEPGEYSVRLNDRDLGTVVVVDAPTSTPGTPTPGETPTPGTPDDRTPIDLEEPRAGLGWLGDVGLVILLYVVATIAVILGVRRFE